MNPLTFANNLTRQTGELLLEYFSPRGRKASLKSDRTVVTEADLAADRLITTAIQENFPDDTLLSEELHPEVGEETGAVWVIDPLDGTTNFSLGLHYWGTSIARLEGGWPQVAALYFPLFDELYSAQKGIGASLNGESLQIKLPDKSQPISFFSCCSRTFRRYDVRVPYKTRILGAASYTLCAVARGSAILGFEATPKIWDIAGGWLVVKEAGGMVETLDGSQPFPLLPGRDYSKRDYPILTAAIAEEITKAHSWIQPKERS
jgi:myo-inositol-1(or 4)-monophosphatase